MVHTATTEFKVSARDPNIGAVGFCSVLKHQVYSEYYNSTNKILRSFVMVGTGVYEVVFDDELNKNSSEFTIKASSYFPDKVFDRLKLHTKFKISKV